MRFTRPLVIRTPLTRVPSCRYFETSANSGQNVQDMFMHLFVSVYQKYWPSKKRGRKKRRA